MSQEISDGEQGTIPVDVNSKDRPTLAEINVIFSKHSPEKIKKELKYPAGNGYLRLKNSRYQSMTNQLSFQKTEEMAPLINKLISDQIRTGNFTGNLQSKYGLYPEGYQEYFYFFSLAPIDESRH